MQTLSIDLKPVLTDLEKNDFIQLADRYRRSMLEWYELGMLFNFKTVNSLSSVQRLGYTNVYLGLWVSAIEKIEYQECDYFSEISEVAYLFKRGYDYGHSFLSKKSLSIFRRMPYMQFNRCTLLGNVERLKMYYLPLVDWVQQFVVMTEVELEHHIRGLQYYLLVKQLVDDLKDFDHDKTIGKLTFVTCNFKYDEQFLVNIYNLCRRLLDRSVELYPDFPYRRRLEKIFKT